MAWDWVGGGCRFICVEGVRSSRLTKGTMLARVTWLSLGCSADSLCPPPVGGAIERNLLNEKRQVGKLIEGAESARL